MAGVLSDGARMGARDGENPDDRRDDAGADAHGRPRSTRAPHGPAACLAANAAVLSPPPSQGGTMKAQERLAVLSAEIAEARTSLRIVEEQLAFVEEVAEDARIRALVSETPLADREYREAR